ncbi:pyridoxal phosphate homeostasis protein-like [Oppia nitens]|uniref:pyridoxal phosphate homeostasis protein-like n=1 Tax=Oppia nitens TaxID=1686743 RepID=UPI0023D9D2AE|nr:pyridoxal phosphate homeostasis protein-like [Oppia nitens]
MATTGDSIDRCLDCIRQRVAQAVKLRDSSAGTVGRPVKLVAASKSQPAEAIIEAYRAGQRIFAENYIQEMCHKSADPVVISSCPDIEWRLIGHIQSNKVNQVLRVDRLVAIETIDSIKIAQTLEKALTARNKTLEAMVQINSGEEDVKTGVLPSDVIELVRYVRDECPHLKLTGLMTIGRFGHDWTTGTNPDFLTFIDSRNNICETLDIPLDSLELSFGMTADFEQAIALGSTQVRVGTAIFGAR